MRDEGGGPLQRPAGDDGGGRSGWRRRWGGDRREGQLRLDPPPRMSGVQANAGEATRVAEAEHDVEDDVEDVAEDGVLMRALRDCNLPKLVLDDVEVKAEALADEAALPEAVEEVEQGHGSKHGGSKMKSPLLMSGGGPPSEAEVAQV